MFWGFFYVCFYSPFVSASLCILSVFIIKTECALKELGAAVFDECVGRLDTCATQPHPRKHSNCA